MNQTQIFCRKELSRIKQADFANENIERDIFSQLF